LPFFGSGSFREGHVVTKRRGPRFNEFAAVEAGVRAVTAPGKRGAGLFFSSPEQFTYFMCATTFIFLPMLFLLSVMPFWEHIGKHLNFLYRIIAPTIAGLSFDYRSPTSPDFPIKRFLVGASTMILTLYACAFVPLFSRDGIKRLGLIWITFQRARLLVMFATSGGLFLGIWYMFFSTRLF
jgi:hypothetical protein